MGNKFNKIASAVLGLAMAFAFTGCSSDDDDGSSGGLAGRTYEREDFTKTTGTYASQITNTFTYKFTSNEAGKYTKVQKGWMDGLLTNGGKRKYIDDTQNYDFTYIYEEADGKKIGVIYSSHLTTGQAAFAISDDDKNLCVNSTTGSCSSPFTRK
jgi:hypothetical protein